MTNREICKYMNIDIESITTKERQHIFMVINRLRNKTRFPYITKDYNF